MVTKEWNPPTVEPRSQPRKTRREKREQREIFLSCAAWRFAGETLKFAQPQTLNHSQQQFRQVKLQLTNCIVCSDRIPGEQGYYKRRVLDKRVKIKGRCILANATPGSQKRTPGKHSPTLFARLSGAGFKHLTVELGVWSYFLRCLQRKRYRASFLLERFSKVMGLREYLSDSEVRRSV